MKESVTVELDRLDVYFLRKRYAKLRGVNKNTKSEKLVELAILEIVREQARFELETNGYAPLPDQEVSQKET